MYGFSRNVFLLALVAIALTAGMSAAQTVVPGGDVSGLWEATGSPYLIEGEITVPAGDTLSIAPACSIIFQGHYKLVVNGTLEAVGTETDSIVFTAADQDSGWHSIRFISAADSSHLSYCLIEYGRATGDYPDNRGGGIYCNDSNPVISHCTVRENSAISGGGIACDNNSDARITSCDVSDNSALNSDGGGIHCWNGSDPDVSFCIISGNFSMYYGAGVFCGSSSNPTIDRCTISRNSANAGGGGLNSYLSNPVIINSIVEGNTGSGGVNLYGSGGTSITYSDFYNNSGGNFTGNSIPSGLGVVTAVNANGDPCDVFNNIFLNPLFEDPSNGDFQITWANFPTWDATRSPCIDAGNPDSLNFDPDSTVADMGALHFDQSTFPPVPDIEVSSSLLDFGSVTVGSQAALPLTIYNLGNRALVINDIYASDPSFSTDFDPADSLVFPTDSLFITVFFDPQDTVAYDEALTIENDDELTEIGLQGIGTPPPEPAISVSADTLAFDSVMVGYQADLPLVIYNLGDTTLVLYDVTTTDPAFSTDFDPADSLIAAGDSLTLTVTFSPAEAISYDDTLSIANNDELVEVALSGIGTPPPEPAISVSADTLAFDSVMVGYQADLPLVIYNSGDTTLVLYDVTTTDPAFSTDFDPADSLIAAGDSLALTVTFSPVALESYDDTLSITNNDELVEVALSGIGSPPPEPAISVSADTLAFDSVMVGYQADLPLVIYNSGDTTLVLYDVTTTNPAFSTSFVPADSLIAAGDSLTLTVSFSPAEAIVYEDTLTIQSNDDPALVILSGTGWIAQPQVTVNADTLDFGEVVIDDQLDLSVVLYNVGDTTLVLYDITTTDSAFSTDYDPADSLIAPGDSLIVTVTFAPAEIASYNDTLVIENNDELKYVLLIGEGVGPVAITLTPYNPPIVVPAAGGSFDFNIAVENLTAEAQTFDLWTVIRLPEVGEVPVLSISDITLPAGIFVSRDRSQQVPDFAPSGIYTYYGYVGSYPWVIEDYSTFTFEKEGGDADGSLGSPADWICSGEGFEEWLLSSRQFIPDVYSLSQNFPNPFNPSTTIRFGLPEVAKVNLAVYNVMGRQVALLIDGYREPGMHDVTFDAANLPSGIYFARLTAGSFQQTQKMVLMK